MSSTTEDTAIADNFNESHDSSSSYVLPPVDIGPETIFVPVCWSLIIAIGVTANALVIYVVVFQMKMSTVTNLYIVNLALTDITFLSFCTPFTIVIFTLYGHMTQGMCTVIAYIQQASVHATCMTLTIMSVDRFFAIVYPFKSLKYRTRRLSFLLNFGVWILSFAMATPAAIFVEAGSHYYYIHEKTFCFETFGSNKALYYSYVLISTYLLPLAVICVCYSLLLRSMWAKANPTANSNRHARRSMQQKKRTTKMLLTVVFLFFLFWLPVHVLNCWQRYNPKSYPSNYTTYYASIVALTLAYSNSCVNPFVYAFMGNNFRNSFKKAFPLCFGRQVGGRSRWQRRGTEEGTRVSIVDRRIMQMPANDNNEMAPCDQAVL